MQKHERIAIEEMERVFDAAGWAHERVKCDSHLALKITDLDGGQHKLIVSGSPRSDATAQKNFARQKAQRLIATFVAERQRKPAHGPHRSVTPGNDVVDRARPRKAKRRR